MRRMLRTGLGVSIAILLLAACAGSDQGVVDQPDIPAQDPDLVAAGVDLFQANCSACHGTDLRGTGSGPSLLSEVYVPSHHADGSFLVAVTAGSPQHHWDFGPMPPVAGLSEADVAAITAFVREQQRVEGFEPYPPD